MLYLIELASLAEASAVCVLNVSDSAPIANSVSVIPEAFLFNDFPLPYILRARSILKQRLRIDFLLSLHTSLSRAEIVHATTNLQIEVEDGSTMLITYWAHRYTDEIEGERRIENEEKQSNRWNNNNTHNN